VAVEVLMPKLGMTMEQGKLVSWSKSEKDTVQKGEIICIIETDKVTFEVESPGTGILLILMEPAENILVGTLMGYIAENQAEYDQLKQGKRPGGAAQPEVAPQPEKSAACWLDNAGPAVPSETGKLRASPASRALAKKLGVALASCQGTGPKGRITTGDVQKAASAPVAGAPVKTPEKVEATPGARKLAKDKGISLTQVHGTGPNGTVTRRDVIEAMKGASPGMPAAVLPPDFKGKRLLKEESMSTIRNTISCRMMESLECSAQMTAFGEWDITGIKQLRKLINEEAKKEGYKVSFPGLMVFFLSRVLKEMPVFNASVSGKNIQYWADVNIGVAVSVGETLVVPVVHGAERKSLKEIQITLDNLIERARNKKLLPDDMGGGTFTLSNVGSYGSQWETVILNPPEVALLGIGAMEKKPVVRNDEIVIREMMPISLTFDHRIIDGATAGEFRNRMKRIVENPELIISYF
jgi:pyruvate dehydrogenase E2 component (dihydrolipoamide acetyltransferase)